jgi:hypothetical protein
MKITELPLENINELDNTSIILYDYIINEDNCSKLKKGAINVKSIASNYSVNELIEQNKKIINIINELAERLSKIENKIENINMTDDNISKISYLQEDVKLIKEQLYHNILEL